MSLIEGYKDLSRWNKRDVASLTGFDRTYIAIALAALGTSFAAYPKIYPYAFIGSWILLSFWILLSWRYCTRIYERFYIMKQIEKELKFEAHRRLKKILLPPRDWLLRVFFYLTILFFSPFAFRHEEVLPQLGRSDPRMLLGWIPFLISLWIGFVNVKYTDQGENNSPPSIKIPE